MLHTGSISKKGELQMLQLGVDMARLSGTILKYEQLFVLRISNQTIL
jgi:hypothetical protein